MKDNKNERNDANRDPISCEAGARVDKRQESETKPVSGTVRKDVEIDESTAPGSRLENEKGRITTPTPCQAKERGRNR